jgi:uncharacterized peroxidase-related enzyme
MKKLSVLTKEQASEQSRQIFEGIEKSVGMLPNIYAVIGNSPNALSAFLAFSDAQKNSTFNTREKEAIALAVSEVNGCNYCRSAHTAIARMNGFSEEETLQLRAGTIHNPKLNVVINLAKSLVENRGNADENLVQKFFEAGYDEKALVDLVLQVASMTFTTYIGRLAKPAIDFPVAKPLHIQEAA